MKTNRIEIIISGIGGQGVVYSANLLGYAALYRHSFSSNIAHYGPESRGSITTSEIVISDFKKSNPNNQIDYPCVESPDIFMTLHQKGLDHHITNQKINTSNLKYLIYDSTLVCIPKAITGTLKQVNSIGIPASQLAKEKFNNIMIANIILTATLGKLTGIISRKNLERALKGMMNANDYKINLQAIEIGYSTSTHSQMAS
jgi:2-oxoglutarate ferredoxin oxidoreductase subunit gamma